MATSTERNRRLRQIARARGLCITCCKGQPPIGKAVCANCTSHIIVRQKQRRASTQLQAELSRIIAAHEQAGDRAREHHLYDDAAQWYRKGLALAGIIFADRLRITEKLRDAYLLGEDPTAAAPIAQWLANEYAGSKENPKKAVEALMSVATQLYLDSKTEQALPVLEQASRIAGSAGLSDGQTLASLQSVRYLRALDRTAEAHELFSKIPPPGEGDDLGVQSEYYKESGMFLLSRGKPQEAYQAFENALKAANENLDVESVAGIWSAYAFESWRDGDIERAKSGFESAIVIAQEYRMLWRLSYYCAYYAHFLAATGLYAMARDYLIRAYSYKVQAPIVEVLFAEVGIPLAMKLNDNELLARFEQPSLISRAFQNGNPTHIGSLSAAFAALYASRGEYKKAKGLLHRALSRLHRLDWNWDVLLAVARHGSTSDLPIARRLFERTPTQGTFTTAFLHLFDAFAAQRNKQYDASRHYALEAIQKFEAMHLYGYADTARILVELSPSSSNRPANIHLPLARLELTPRERQVAELVLRGYTNRAIAATLSITENTVEKHMTAIIGRLGVRSRHQLAEALPGLRIP